ncbi:MAG: hypothetical protein MUC46_07460, partial [Desulfobacterales bacterium]|nr:hypothetical protein [Desulfobacterales bacterium]
MYLASVNDCGRPHFYIRESFEREGVYCHRDLFDLGPTPGRLIVYPGGNSFYVDEEVEETIRSRGTETNQEELETIFWP